MLSVLIPVYNFSVYSLVETLHQQAAHLSQDIEFICVDDASEASYKERNSCLTQLENVRYLELTENMGRSKIRNYLASLAHYDYLLFMDCDSMPVSDQYLYNYIRRLSPNKLLYGGRVYAHEPPKKTDWYFHWYCGKHREESTAEQRQKQPYRSFMTNNFLIPKAIFEQIGFDEQLTQYGHEDTLFGAELQKRGVPILHLDNPLEHIGLEPVDEFLDKSKKAIQNLYTLSRQHELEQEVKLLRTYQNVKSWKMKRLIWAFYNLFSPILIKNIKSKRPFLRLFDLYKLGYLIDWAIRRSKEQQKQ